MSTGYVYNARPTGITRDGVEGIELMYGGLGFWFPRGQVTPVPDFAFREVDQDKSTPERGEVGVVRYKCENITGKRIAEELTMRQMPITNHDTGVQMIEGKLTGAVKVVYTGNSEYEGTPTFTEVPERTATKTEIDRAEKSAKDYMYLVIADYFQSKRSRMGNGQGKNTPDPIIRFYMELLNVEDNDDVTTHQKAIGGMTPEILKLILEENRKSSEVTGAMVERAIDTVKKRGKRGFGVKPVGLGLKQRKAEYDAQQTEQDKPEVPVSGE